MSKSAPQSAVWNFTVTQRQLPSPIVGRGPLPFFGNFREDTGECLGVTSEQYGIVQNAVLIEAARGALASRGLVGYDEKIFVTGNNGERLHATFTFANKQLASGVGDIFGYRLILRNSFDRSLRAAFQLGFLRLVCMNGASTMEGEFNVTRKHSSKVTVDFVGEAIDRAMANGQNALRVFDQMASVALNDEQGVNVLNQLVALDALSGSLRDSIKPLWLAPRRAEDKARTVYALYNAITEHLTHQVADSRLEYAHRVSNNVLVRLVNAARHPDKLAKLIVPIPAGVTVTVDTAPVADATGANIIDAEIVPG